MIHGLAAIDKNGRIVFACAKCGSLAQSAYGAQNKDDLAYLLVCSNDKCANVLGEWTTRQQKDEELKAFAKQAQR